MTDEQWKKGLPWLVGLFFGDEKLASYIGIIINYYKDPYSTTSIMESRRVFFVAQMSLNFDKPDKDFRQEFPFQGLIVWLSHACSKHEQANLIECNKVWRIMKKSIPCHPWWLLKLWMTLTWCLIDKEGKFVQDARMHCSIEYEEATCSFKVNKRPDPDSFLYIQKPPNSKPDEAPVTNINPKKLKGWWLNTSIHMACVCSIFFSNQKTSWKRSKVKNWHPAIVTLLRFISFSHPWVLGPNASQPLGWLPGSS